MATASFYREHKFSNYSTTVIHRHSQEQTAPPLSSVLTVRASPILPPPLPDRPLSAETYSVVVTNRRSRVIPPSPRCHISSPPKKLRSAAIEGGSSLQVHHITLIKLGLTTKRLTSAAGGERQEPACDVRLERARLFSSRAGCFLAVVPNIISTPSGLKLCWNGGDCSLRAHVKCGEMAPRDCGIRASSSMMRVASAPQPARVPTSAAAAGPGGGGKAKVPTVLASSLRQ